jgi:hypothetical protein
VVNTTSDAASAPLGDLTLRQAVNLANVLDGAETITFDPAVFATAQTITLTQGQLDLSDTGGTETIVGPAAGVTISGGDTSRVFEVDSGVVASLSGLTISGGATTANGGGLDNDGTTTLNDVTISANSAAGGGGGVCNNGTATLTNCTISDNTAGFGGGLSIASGATTTLIFCTVSGNSATSAWGGLDVAGAGSAALTDTIVAGNTGSSGASDIGGNGNVSGANNLIGTGGSGGLIDKVDGNIVGVANPGLAPLGDYGGPTETMALLPASAAIGAGAADSGIATDQRGAPRPTTGAIDMGAFQDQGYTLAVSSGSPQATMISQPFSAPLVVVLTEDFSHAPLPGATIGFAAPPSGASAALSASSAVTSASGTASITAKANATPGAYDVIASTLGVTSPASFSLTNQAQPSFAGLTGQTATYGSTVTFTGTLAAGLHAPAGEDVGLTIDGVTHQATIAANGSFSTQFTGADVVLNASATAYVVTYDYSTDGTFLAATGSSQLTVNPAELTITAVSDTKVYDGTTTSSGTPTCGTLFNSDTVTGLTQAFASKNVLGPGGSTLIVTGYTVNDGDGGKDYAIILESVPGTITPAPLTITATSDTKAYDGNTVSSRVPTYGTLFTDDTVTGLTQAFASKNVLGTNGSTLAVTGFTINDGDDGRDYTVTTATAMGTITPDLLTVRATSVSTVYGLPLPSLTDTITGFVAGESSSVVSGAPVLATTASTSASVGVYTITIAAGTLSATNYNFHLIAGALTVTPAPLVITAVSTTMDTGQPVPELAVVYSGFVDGDTAASLARSPVLATAATSSSAPGTYPITVGGASSPNYMITYVPGTLTVVLAPAIVESVSLETMKVSKHKSLREIVVRFSEALDPSTAQSINSYVLAPVPKHNKRKTKPVTLSQAIYNSSAFTVTLLTRRPLALNPPLDLTIQAAGLRDALGRELDGNDSGRPGANFTAVLSKAGAAVTSARELAPIGGLSSRAVDDVLAEVERFKRPRVGRGA